VSAVRYALEHFYYGQPVKDGKPDGELRLLASSPGITPEMVAESVKLALLPPLVGSANGSWAIVRGKTIPFIMAQSQVGKAGNAMLHYVLIPPEVLRGLGGNLKALMTLVEDEMTTYTSADHKLNSQPLPQAGPPTSEAQVDSILDLMTYTKNRTSTIETLLSAIVQGVQLVVQGAPRELNQRIGFIEGLLALLPPPARFGVTFATHSVPSSKFDAQIRFFTDDTPPEETLIYNWSSGQVSGKTVEDEYSGFIISQLRLDADLVIQQTKALTEVAAWRIKRGDSLAEALGYASHRFKIDTALVNNQPVEAAETSKVLVEDPTLDESLKIAYSRHLLAFALALGEMQHAEPIAIMLRQQPELERAIQSQLSDAINDGKAAIVYEALSRWLSNPLGPAGEEWVDLTHRAALVNMNQLAKQGDVSAVHTYLKNIQSAEAGTQIKRIVPRLIELALPLSMREKPLAETLFLLAAEHLETENFRKLITSKRFTAQLPPKLSNLLPYLNGDQQGSAPAGLLTSVSGALGDQWKSLILLRAAEIALLAGRHDLVDTSALAALAEIALSSWGAQHEQVLRWIALNMSTDDMLLLLEDPGARYLLQILLARGAYLDLANEMLHQSRLLYPGDLQADYALMVERLFAETKIPIEEAPTALQAIEKSGIKSLPLAMAYIGTLEGHQWSPALDEIGNSVTEAIFNNRNMLEVIPPSALMALFKFHTERKDVAKSLRVGSLIPAVASRKGFDGAAMMSQVYKLLNWEERAKVAGMELLRRFVRQADSETAKRAIVRFGKEHGQPIRDALEATYFIKKLMGGVDLVDYADFIHITAEFLNDTMRAYADKNRYPQISGIIGDLQSMPGGLTDDDRRLIASEVLSVGQTIIALYNQFRNNRARNLEDHIDKLLEGSAQPQNALDVLRTMGGYFAKGKRFRIKLDQEAHSHPLGERSSTMLKDEVQIVTGVLRGALEAFPPTRKVTTPISVIRAEIESLWGDISLHQQREIVRNLATDLQRVPDLVVMIAEKGDAKVVEADSSAGRSLDSLKQRPKSTLEYYRFVYGYYKSRAR
jgi:hypothetical protein